MNGVLLATRIMKGHEVVKKCAEARNNPLLLEAMESEAKRKLYEMNRKVSTRREVS
ncbi:MULTISPECIES: hypothetical protein [Bacillus cereus group]|uniref:Uncharacterized protein n=1 Tax=Bacillus thuringiensis subsp. tolworthi TaxID=1442 RepID=A0A9W3ZXY7_BACTO|nr:MULTISPECIES: hypothetical protein [Bacillus cereus group]MEB8717396.1 hypothetical protein [Bacillus cereus]MEB9433198.1 hypothetical protein [Bacillus cereus]MEB9480753.1 hypothetical protein [Bacillus cereus]MEB9594902.1 hypothetical protein [Bacillus cereus]BAR85755.1 uncharacterized protein KNN_04912 [Bacillus thuringiensis serovar tolworthi]